jgi:hypothetical protein
MAQGRGEVKLIFIFNNPDNVPPTESLTAWLAMLAKG